MKYRGFSLVELLVTVFITSIVVIAAYRLMTGSNENFRDLDARRMLDANLRNAELLLQRDLSRAGYASGFNSSALSGGCKARLMKSGEPDYLAFQHHRDAHQFSEFRIVASLSDYQGFSVSCADGPVLQITNSIVKPLVAHQVEETNPSNDVAQNEEFDAIFDRQFRGASAVELTTPTGDTLIVPIANVNNATHQITLARDISQLQGVCNMELLNSCGSVDPNSPSTVTVNPIVAINYRVNNNNLMRCITPVFANNVFPANPSGAHNPGDPPSVNVPDGWSCEVLVENIAYFDLFPLTDGNQLKNIYGEMAGNQGMGHAPSQAGAQFNPSWSHVRLGELQGLAYRFGAWSSREASNPANIPGQTYQSYKFDEDGAGHAYQHVAGTSLFRTRRETVETSDAALADVP